MAAILPGATLGIFGGGQLGRMTAQAARSMGYRVHVLDPDPQCAAKHIVERCVTASFEDVEAAAVLAQGVSVVTLEIEKVSLDSLRKAASYAPVRPSADVLEIIQDRGRQKAWLGSKGFPLGPYRHALTAEAIVEAVRDLGGPCFVKACSGGYDGRGQVHVPVAEKGHGAFGDLGGGPVVVELGLDLEAELSVLVARNPSGQVAVYPPALNHHENRILEWSVLPGPIPPQVARAATEIAEAMAHAIGLEGLLAVEFFLLRDGRLLVNELAPRPHNSFHATEMACVTSQFEQLVRTACDLPLGSTDIVRPAAIVNLLGDLWVGDAPPAFDQALAVPGVRVFLYGKGQARPGRKMGHLCASGATPEEAVSKVKQAQERLLRRA